MANGLFYVFSNFDKTSFIYNIDIQTKNMRVFPRIPTLFSVSPQYYKIF